MIIISTPVGKNPPIKRNGVGLRDDKRVWNAVFGCNLKNYRMILVHFQGKPFNIRVIQVYSPTTDASKEAKLDQFCEDQQDLLELTLKKKKVLIIIGDWNAKVGSQEVP